MIILCFDDLIKSNGKLNKIKFIFRTPYLALAKTFEAIEEISGRLRMIEMLANFFRSVILLSPNDLIACVYLSLNQLAPAYEGLELGIAETSLMKVIMQTTGRSMAQIKADSQSTGDLGIVAERSKSNQRMMFVPAPLTVEAVFTRLKEIAKMSGHAVSIICHQSGCLDFDLVLFHISRQ